MGFFCNGYFTSNYVNYKDTVDNTKTQYHMYNVWDTRTDPNVPTSNYYELSFVCNQNVPGKDICGTSDTIAPGTNQIPGFFVRKLKFAS